MDVRESLASKLRTARSSTGMSTWAVAKGLKSRISISHATIANYERGRSVPPMDVLAIFAELYGRPLNWFLERGRSLTGVHYRNLRSRVKAGDLHRFEADVQRWVDAYATLELRLKRPLRSSTNKKVHTKPGADPGDLARDVRSEMKLKEDEPVLSVVDVLERYGIRVLENPTELRIDGMAAKYDDEYVVVLNPTVSNDRSRLNAAHELGHVLLGDCESDGPSEKENERKAFDFASQFLLPNAQLKRAFQGKSMVRLVQTKERFGISLAAMVYRAEKLGFVTKSEAKSLWMEFARRGWRTKEPGAVRPDRATRFEQLMDEALASGRMSAKEIADLAGVRPESIRKRLNLAMGTEENTGFEDDEAGIIKFPE